MGGFVLEWYEIVCEKDTRLKFLLKALLFLCFVWFCRGCFSANLQLTLLSFRLSLGGPSSFEANSLSLPIPPPLVSSLSFLFSSLVVLLSLSASPPPLLAFSRLSNAASPYNIDRAKTYFDCCIVHLDIQKWQILGSNMTQKRK